MFNLFYRWFGWTGRPVNNPDDKGPITRTTLVIDLTNRATIVIAPTRTTKVL